MDWKRPFASDATGLQALAFGDKLSADPALVIICLAAGRPARLTLCLVEMEMIGMGLVIIRRQDGTEIVATAVADGTQERAAAIGRVPMIDQADSAPVT